MPFVAILVLLLVAIIGTCTDFMRDFECVNQLEFAAQSAASYGLSYATDSLGNYSPATAQANIANQIVNNGAVASWNSAPRGPNQGAWNAPVAFDQGDINFVANPNALDPTDFFLQVTATRNGADALQHFFLPLAYIQLPQATPPTPLTKFSTFQTVEVLGQPATRIGAGAPLNSSAGTRAADMIGFAALPIAISNLQFAAASAAGRNGGSFTVNFVAAATGTVPAGHIKGCFANLTASGTSSGSYYNAASGNSAVNQLESLLSYFGASSSQSAIPPTVVERGSQLNFFLPSDPSFSSHQGEISAALAKLPVGRFYIVPVLANDPFTANNIVIGFARVQLTVPITGVNGSATIQLGESVPLRNATSATGLASTATNPGIGTQMPLSPPPAPFAPRTVDPSSGGMTARPWGVVLAPALSPRQLQPGVL